MLSSLASLLSARRLARAEARREAAKKELQPLVEAQPHASAAPSALESSPPALADDSGSSPAFGESVAVDPLVMAAVEAAAAAAQEARVGDISDEECKAWGEYGGAKLEAALEVDSSLGDSAVRLIDGRFLIELHKRGGLLVRRQLLPEGAFISLDDVKRLPPGGDASDCLRIASVSHAWQQPDTPDPKGVSLKLLAEFLEVLLTRGGCTYGIFLE